MKNFLHHWNFARIVRMLLGIFIIIQGIFTGNWLTVTLGALFSLMPLLNIGCCTTATCAPNNRKRKMEDITYEEVH